MSEINSFSAIFMNTTSIDDKKKKNPRRPRKIFNLKKSLTKQADGIDQRLDFTFFAV